MTHVKPMAESEGVFDKWKPETEGYHANCKKCGAKDVVWRSWESSCGGYEDHKYKCRSCGHTWWVEGPDA